MSKERLEEIKQIKEEASRHFRNADTFNFSFMLKKLYKDRHIDYLIEQAERVSKQETRINNLTFNLAVSRVQNKHYRALLERVCQVEDLEDVWDIEDDYRALEGEE